MLKPEQCIGRTYVGGWNKLSRQEMDGGLDSRAELGSTEVKTSDDLWDHHEDENICDWAREQGCFDADAPCRLAERTC